MGQQDIFRPDPVQNVVGVCHEVVVSLVGKDQQIRAVRVVFLRQEVEAPQQQDLLFFCADFEGNDLTALLEGTVCPEQEGHVREVAQHPVGGEGGGNVPAVEFDVFSAEHVHSDIGKGQLHPGLDDGDIAGVFCIALQCTCGQLRAENRGIGFVNQLRHEVQVIEMPVCDEDGIVVQKILQARRIGPAPQREKRVDEQLFPGCLDHKGCRALPGDVHSYYPPKYVDMKFVTILFVWDREPSPVPFSQQIFVTTLSAWDREPSLSHNGRRDMTEAPADAALLFFCAVNCCCVSVLGR